MSSGRSGQNTGTRRMTRETFAELRQRLDVHLISWNKVGNCYTELGQTEFGFLNRPFAARSRAAARPERSAKSRAVGGCLIVDQSTPHAVAEGIKTLLLDQPFYSRLCEEARARRFRSWSEYIDKLLIHLQTPRGTTKPVCD